VGERERNESRKEIKAKEEIRDKGERERRRE